MKARVFRRVSLGLLVLTGRLAGQESPTLTPTVFQRYSDRVVRIQVVESGSAAKAGLGSGFLVSDRGHVVTNYHVVADVIHDPERYHAELAEAAAVPDTLTILAVDVVHDLAILGSGRRPLRHFVLRAATAQQGDRLYALGHPGDLGLSIVEGTHNGLLRHTLYPKVHFTGSINPGMSGGPTIAADGRVIGVNVSTFGNQMSFLVPVGRALALLATVMAPNYRPPANLLDDVGRQIRTYQDEYLTNLFAAPVKTVQLGPYRVVTEPAPYFRCWGDSGQQGELPYEWVDHECSTDDYVYIASDQESGVVEMTHELITTSSLGAQRFFALYADTFGRDNTPFGDEAHVTSWRCGTRNLRNAAGPLRVVLCLRRYRKLGELYDAVLKAAVLGQRESGLVSTLTLSGVSFENVARLTSRYLNQISWR